MEYIIANMFWLTVGWLFMTFVIETILVAGKGWKVGKETPVYSNVWETEFDISFCSLFWKTLYMYFIMFFCMYLLGGVLSFAGIVLLDTTVPLLFIPATVLSSALLFIMGVMVAVYSVGWGVKKLWCSITSKSNVDKEGIFVEGIKTWYSQVKDRYCPIITKEESK